MPHLELLQQLLQLAKQLRRLNQLPSTKGFKQLFHDGTGTFLRRLLPGKVLLSGGFVVLGRLGTVQGVHDAAVTGQKELVVVALLLSAGVVSIGEEAVFVLWALVGPIHDHVLSLLHSDSDSGTDCKAGCCWRDDNLLALFDLQSNSTPEVLGISTVTDILCAQCCW